jgi:hypothetical protein
LFNGFVKAAIAQGETITAPITVATPGLAETAPAAVPEAHPAVETAEPARSPTP